MKRSNWWTQALRTTALAAAASLACTGISYFLMDTLPRITVQSSTHGESSSIAIVQPAKAYFSYQSYAGCTAQMPPKDIMQAINVDKPHRTPPTPSCQPDGQKKASIAAAAMNRPGAYSTARTDGNHKEELQHAIQQAILALSEHEPYTSWINATTDIMPLGPGTHGWLIRMLDADGQALGYLIMHANEQGQYKLTEYGAGKELPYDLAALTQSLQNKGYHPLQVQLEAIYPSTLLALWKVSSDGAVFYLDAFTGEEIPYEEKEIHLVKDKPGARLPLTLSSQTIEAPIQTRLRALTSPDGAITNSQPMAAAAAEIGNWFDVYENLQWMSLKHQLDKNAAEDKLNHWNPTSSMRLIYVHSLMKDAVRIPYVLQGRQIWQLNSRIAKNAQASSSFMVNQEEESKQAAYFGLAHEANADILRWIMQDDLLQQGDIVPYSVSK